MSGSSGADPNVVHSNTLALQASANGSQPTQQAYQPTASLDVVGVFDASHNQLFADARPIKASVRQVAKVMEHPVETGETVTDHMVIEPTTITLSLIFTPETYVSMFRQVVSIWKVGTVIFVQTKVGLFGNMIISELPHEEDPAHFDTITMNLKLKHVIFVTAQSSKLPPGSTKTNKGNKTASAIATPSKASDAATGQARNSGLYDLLGYGKPATPTATEHE